MNIVPIMSANNNASRQYKPSFEAKFDKATIKYLDWRVGKKLRIQMQNVIKPLIVENAKYPQRGKKVYHPYFHIRKKGECAYKHPLSVYCGTSCGRGKSIEKKSFNTFPTTLESFKENVLPLIKDMIEELSKIGI